MRRSPGETRLALRRAATAGALALGLATGALLAQTLAAAAPAPGAAPGGPIPPAGTAAKATTDPADLITQTTARVNGHIDLNGQSATYHFDYGATGAYGSSTAPAAAGPATGLAATATAVSAPLTGLAPATGYHFRLAAVDATGSVSDGADQTFTTLAATPTTPATPPGPTPGLIAPILGGLNPGCKPPPPTRRPGFVVSADGHALRFNRLVLVARDDCWHFDLLLPTTSNATARLAAVTHQPGVAPLDQARFHTTGSVAVNGLWLNPIVKGREFRVNTGTATLSAGNAGVGGAARAITTPAPGPEFAPYVVSGDGLALAHVDLARQPWSLDAQHHLADLRATSISPAPAVHGFRLVGNAGVYAPASGQALVRGQLQMPGFFSDPANGIQPPTASLELGYTATAHTAQAAAIHLTLPSAHIAGLEIDNAFLDYDPATDTWHGGGDFLLGGYALHAVPPPDTNGLAVHSGAFAGAGGDLDFGQQGPALFPGVNLRHISFAVGVDPLRFAGTLGLSVAQGLLTADGSFLAVFASPNAPYRYSSGALGGVDQLQTQAPITGTALGVSANAILHVGIDLELGSGYMFYIDPGYFEFAGRIQQNILGTPLTLRAAVKGALDIGRARFNLAGDVSACLDFPDPIGSQCAGANGVLSSAGAGACGHFNTVFNDFYFGFRYAWHGGLTIFLDDCNLGPITVDVRAAQADAPRTFHLAPGLPSATVIVEGNGGGPPRVRITGPTGASGANTEVNRAVHTGPFVILPMRQLDTTYIGIDHPPAGAWTITALPGSPPIGGLRHADGLPGPRIRATVSGGRGRGRTLHYAIRPREGERVTFVEQGPRVYHVLGQAHGAHGQIAFQPADGPAAERQIVAQIELSGAPVPAVLAGRYAAPAPISATRPARLRLTRRGQGLLVRWSAAANAVRYLVAVSTTDGRVLEIPAAAGRRSVNVDTVPNTGASVSVAGITRDGRLGPRATARLRPVR